MAESWISRIDRVRKQAVLCLKTVAGLVAAAIVGDELWRMKSLSLVGLPVPYLLLLATSAILLALWLWSTSAELEMLIEWLEPERYRPPASIVEVGVVFYFAVILPLLLFAARNPLAYGLLFTLYSMVLIPSTYYMLREIRKAVAGCCGARDRGGAIKRKNLKDQVSLPPKLRRQAAAIIRHYYCRRPQVRRQAVILAASCFVTGAAVWGYFARQTWIGAVAQVLFATIILISEVVIGYWRWKRDTDLLPLFEEKESLRNAR